MRLLYRYEQLMQDFWFSISVEPTCASTSRNCDRDHFLGDLYIVFSLL